MAKRVKIEEVEGIPSWAIPWFEYGCEANLPEEDVDLIKAWMKENPQLRFMSCGESEGFNSCPAFGLACDTYTRTFEKMPRPRKKTAKKPPAPDKVLHLCFTDEDPDGMSSPIVKDQVSPHRIRSTGP